MRKSIFFTFLIFSLFQLIRVQAQDPCDNDVVAPVVVVHPSITVSLDETGQVTITPEMIDNGSFDNCSEVTLSIDKEVFYESDIGANTVSLTVTDEAGNFNKGWSRVLVDPYESSCENDTTPIQIIWPSDITVESSEGEITQNTYPLLLSSHDTYNPVTDTGLVYGEPYLIYDCELPGTNYADQLFIVDSNTREIIRTWTVVDWDDAEFEATRDQVITVNLLPDPCGNDTTPVALMRWPADITISSEESLIYNNTRPSRLARFNTYNPQMQSGEVYDEPVLDYDCETVNFGFTDRVYNNFPNQQRIIRHWQYIVWETGEIKDDEQEILINILPDNDCANDQLPPLAICESEVEVHLDASGTADLHPITIDAGSYDNCSIASMYLDVDTFDEDDLGNNRVSLTVVDGAGNESSCWTTVQVNPYEQGQIQLCIHTVLGDPLSGVELTNGVFTDNTGCAFVNRSDELLLHYDDPYDNGVDVLDLLKMRRAILASENLDFYQSLAGDINGSEAITTYDLIQLMDLVTGERDSFISVDSWIFHSKDVLDFTNLFGQTWTLGAPTVDVFDLEDKGGPVRLTAIKMGDLDYSAQFDGRVRPERQLSPFTIVAEDQVLNNGMEYEIPVYTAFADHFIALDWSFQYNGTGIRNGGIEIIDVQSEYLNDMEVFIADGNVRVVSLGVLDPSLPLNEELALFTIRIRANENSILSNELFLSTNENNSLLGWGNESTTPYFLDFEWDGEIILNNQENQLDTEQAFQVFPNPATDQWIIKSESHQGGVFQMTDAYGRTVRQTTFRGSVVLHRNELAPGVYMFNIMSEGASVQQGQLILLD